MALSMYFHESEEIITDEMLKKLQKYYDDKENPTEISTLINQISVGTVKYKIFRIAKKINKNFQVYKIEEGNIVPTEEETEVWDTNYAYIRIDSKFVYVSGSSYGWVSNFISRKLFEDENRIRIMEIDTKKLEDDVRKSNKFTPIGASFVDEEQTKVTIKNPAGLDFETNKYMKDMAEIEKGHIDIIIQKDDLNLNILVYPQGKVTFQGYTKDKETALRIFLKIWNEIKEYS